MDVKELCKKASAEIKKLRAENLSLKSTIGKQKKYASLARNRKKAVGEVVAEVVDEVKTKLEEMNVPAEAVTEAADIVETAVAEAVSEAAPEEVAAAETGDVIDQETKDELAQVASSDEIEDEEVKMAAGKLLKSCNSKQAFGKEVIKLIKKMSAGNFSGSVIPRNNGGAPRKSKALTELQDFARSTK